MFAIIVIKEQGSVKTIMMHWPQQVGISGGCNHAVHPGVMNLPEVLVLSGRQRKKSVSEVVDKWKLSCKIDKYMKKSEWKQDMFPIISSSHKRKMFGLGTTSVFLYIGECLQKTLKMCPYIRFSHHL